MNTLKTLPGMVYGWSCIPEKGYHTWNGEGPLCQCQERDRTVNDGAKKGAPA